MPGLVSGLQSLRPSETLYRKRKVKWTSNEGLDPGQRLCGRNHQALHLQTVNDRFHLGKERSLQSTSAKMSTAPSLRAPIKAASGRCSSLQNSSFRNEGQAFSAVGELQSDLGRQISARECPTGSSCIAVHDPLSVKWSHIRPLRESEFWLRNTCSCFGDACQVVEALMCSPPHLFCCLSH